MKVTIRTFDLTNEWALIADYTSAWRIDSRSLCKAFLVQLRPFRFISSSSIDDQTISTAETLIYNRFVRRFCSNRCTSIKSSSTCSNLRICFIRKYLQWNVRIWTFKECSLFSSKHRLIKYSQHLKCAFIQTFPYRVYWSMVYPILFFRIINKH
jgi:hypothetical protein